MNTHRFRAQWSKGRSRRRFRPAVLGLDQRIMLTSAAAGAVTPAQVAQPSAVGAVAGQDLPLSVKRVPGFLSGPKYNDLATPYDNPSIAGLRIDDKTVDYWKITLNKGDAVLLSLIPLSLPSGGASPTNFAIRIWGPDKEEILPPGRQPVSATQFTYVASAAGTSLGISTSNHVRYAFRPDLPQQPPSDASGSLHVYTAAFSTYPGEHTNLVDILKNDSADWPTWSGDRLRAYNTLTEIATRGNNKTGTGIIDFGGSFEQVGTATVAKIDGWLSYTWDPFNELLSQAGQGQARAVAERMYNSHQFPVINAAFKALPSWLSVAIPFVDDSKLQRAFIDVHGTLLTANQDRQNIDTFLHSMTAWSSAYQTIVGSEPDHIAQLLTTGLTKVPEMVKPVQQYGWLKTLIGTIVSLGSGLAGLLGAVFAPGTPAGPAAALATSFLLNAIANPIDAYLDGSFDKDGKKPIDPNQTDTSRAMLGAARQMQTFSATTFGDTFQLLSSPRFEASLFSNYGLLEAMEHVRFSSSIDDQPVPTQELLDNYDTTIWEKLLPTMFKWKPVPYTSDGPVNTLRNFTFYIPRYEGAQWQVPGLGPNKSDGFQRPQAKVVQDAKDELLALQAGHSFSFPGYDFTPKDSFGPGPMSVPQTIEGNSASFYTIDPDTLLEGTLFRGNNGFGYWHTWFYRPYGESDGATIQEWSLQTRTGAQMSQAAGDQLFGTGSLELASQDPVHYPHDDPYDPPYTYDFKVQSGGLATRFDVFTEWGNGVDDFSPHSFSPPDTKQWYDMTVDPDPGGRFAGYRMYANFKLTYK